jgi:LDH2 family malate/lactate/ureidoglycolate dehydrogenase
MTDRTEKDRIRMSVAEARELGEAAMRGVGYDDDEARIMADHVLDAALCGYEYAGLPKLLNMVDAPQFRQPRQPIKVVRETGSTAVIDGGNNNGMLVAHHSAGDAIERAAANGLAIICFSNAWLTGRSAYYCEMIARAGLVAIHTVAISPLVAPFGGTRPALGTNPIAFGFPTEGDPLVIDMGTSAFMYTDLLLRDRIGAPIPEGVALGPNGHPTTDAGAALRGALLPFGGLHGGYKGFGLALAMDALGALAAATRPADDISGYMFIVFNPEVFLPAKDYRREVTRRINMIKATPRQMGVEEIRVPGERSYRTRARLMQEGIEIDRKIHSALGSLAKGELNHGGWSTIHAASAA